jgi:uroporphyrinogen-III synthase
VTAPLAGRRVVVTRAAAQSAGLSERLEALGAEVVELALIRIDEASDGGAALRHALDRLDEYDWLVVSSPNGAARVAEALRGRLPGHPLVAAVGTATAEALGRGADLVPARQVAEGLVDAFPDGTGPLLLVQAEQARPALADGLRARGWSVDVVAAYRTVTVRPDELPPALFDADAVLFGSGSAARSWRQAVGDWTPPVVVAIGPVTAAAAADAGLKVTRVASDHSLTGLIDALAAALDGGP